MLFLISPAKTLDYDTPLPAALQRRATEPLFMDEAAALIEVLRDRSASEVAALMDLSESLATLNVSRYRAWQRSPAPEQVRPAVRAFNGDVYDGLQAASLTTADLNWAQQHLVILSGLYGVLRPLDRLQPYRLEMGTALANPRGRDLYAFWGDRLAQWLDAQLEGTRPAVLVNLASVEYARAALRPALQARVVHCSFEDWKDGQYKIISFFAKRARGLYARWAIQNRVRHVAQLARFEAEGYAFAPEASDTDRLVFRRRVAG